MGKYQHLTDFQIDEKVNSGEFREEGTLIRNCLNGETVKIKSTKDSVATHFPTTFIQVNKNIVYQADLKPVFEYIRSTREEQKFSELEEQYNILLDFLGYYTSYDTHLNELLHESITTAAIFENRIRQYAKTLELDKIDSIDIEPFIGALTAYLNVIFIYIISSFVKNKEKFVNDYIIINKIINFRNIIQNIYEQLLVKSTYNTTTKCTNLEMKDSVYSLYLLDMSFDVFELDNLVQYDSRFSSSLDVIHFFKRFNLKKEYDRGTYTSTYTSKIETRTPKLNKNSNRIKLISKICTTLSELDNLENLRTEILNVEDNEELLTLIESGIRS